MSANKNESLEQAATAYRELCQRQEALTLERDAALADVAAFEASPEYQARKNRRVEAGVTVCRLSAGADAAYWKLLAAAKTGSIDLAGIAAEYRFSLESARSAAVDRDAAGAHWDTLVAGSKAQARWSAACDALSVLTPLLLDAEQALREAAEQHA